MGHGVDHAAVVAHVNSIRRSLVMGENEFVVVCIALDQPTIMRHGEALRSLLSDHRCFPTKVRTVGLLSELGLTREVAELGCDVYVDSSAQAARAIRLLDDEWAAEADAAVRKSGRSWRIRSGWMCGTPELPVELMSLVQPPRGTDGMFPPPPVGGSDEEFGDVKSPQ